MTCPTSVTYTGAALTPCSVTVTGAGGLSLTPTPTYANNTAAGINTASASYTYAGDANHTSSSDSKNFTIDKASSTTVVTFETGPYVYRGSAFTATATVTGAGGLNQPVTVVYSGDCTNVTVTDGCTASATYLADVNHTGSGDAKSITILKAAGSVTISNLPAGGNYGGSFTATYTVLGNGTTSVTSWTTDFCTVAGNVVSYVGVGTCILTAHVTAGTNYLAAVGPPQRFDIGKAASATVITCPLVSQTYTGSALTPCTAEVTGAGLTPINITGAIVYAANTNVGTATADVSWSGDANHEGSIATQATFGSVRPPVRPSSPARW